MATVLEHDRCLDWARINGTLGVRRLPRLVAKQLEPCPHRGETPTAIPHGYCPCGCGSVRVVHCQLHAESVTVRRLARTHAAQELQAAWPHMIRDHVLLRALAPYRGRTCADCPDSPAASAELIERQVRRRWRRPLPDRSQSISMRGITLACVDCVDPQRAAMALDVARWGLGFDEVRLFSHQRPDVLPPGIVWDRVSKLNLDEYNVWWLRDAHRHLKTPYVLAIETDGFPLRPDLWDDAWREWDFVGAPWPPDRPHAQRTPVGNSGCCLRSRRFLQATAAAATPEALHAHRRTWSRIYCDLFPTNDAFDDLTAAGIRFAPPAIAARFSQECKTPWGAALGRSFAFHGRFHAPTDWLQAELPAWVARQRWAASGAKIRIVWNPVRSNDPARAAEYAEAEDLTRGNPWVRDWIELDGWPTFAELVAALDAVSSADDLNVFLNADCYLDETLADLAAQLQPDQFAILTRRERRRDGTWQLWDVEYSQDAWAWRGRSRFRPGDLDYRQRPGCDSKIAYEAHARGYQVINPARDVFVGHLHATRAHVHERPGIERLPAPYLWLRPHRLGQTPAPQILTVYDGPAETDVWRPD